MRIEWNRREISVVIVDHSFRNFNIFFYLGESQWTSVVLMHVFHDFSVHGETAGKFWIYSNKVRFMGKNADFESVQPSIISI